MDDLDRFHAALIAAATRGDWPAVSDDLAALIATVRQLRRELAAARARDGVSEHTTEGAVMCLADGCGERTYALHLYCPTHQLRYERYDELRIAAREAESARAAAERRAEAYHARWRAACEDGQAERDRALAAEADAAALRELYTDVERWRESGGDARELCYVLETADRIRPDSGTALLAELAALRQDRDRADGAVASVMDERAAARAVVDAARQAISRQSWGTLGDALDAHDRARGGRDG